MAASSDGSTVSIRCNFSHLEGCCGKSNHYTNNKVDQIDNCTKDTTTHLNRLHSIDVSSANIPEGLLILYRSGIFSVDRAAKSLSICPWHRDFFGIYWRDNSIKCQFKGHPVGSKAKVDRGITPTLSKEYWLLTRQLIPVGSGISQIYKFLSVKINGIPFHAWFMTQEFWMCTQ